MPRTTIALFVIAHALVTAAIWAAPLTASAPFNPGHSWLLGDSRPFSVPVSLLIALGLAATGVGLITGQSWWAPVGLASGAAAAVFTALYFHPWLVAGLAINVGLAVAAAHHPATA